MNTIRKILIKLMRCLLYGVILFCALGYVREKYYAHTLPYAKVAKRCDGNRTLESICDCYNYYGRQCSSEKRLFWDWSPADDDPALSVPPKHTPDGEEEDAENV